MGVVGERVGQAGVFDQGRSSTSAGCRRGNKPCADVAEAVTVFAGWTVPSIYDENIRFAKVGDRGWDGREAGRRNESGAGR